MTFVVLAAAGFAFALWRILRVDHIAIEPVTHVGGCASENCGRAPVERYHGALYCQDCADYLASVDQEYTDQELAAWERELAGGEGA